MGDFWEIDEILEQADFEHERMLKDTKVVDALVGEECYEVFSWVPRCRVLGWMSRMHSEFKLGTEIFFARDIYENPTSKEAYYQLKKDKSIRIINGTAFEITEKEKDAKFDVIILTCGDLKPLRKTAKNVANHAVSSQEKSFGYMLSAIADAIAYFISENQDIEEFIIYREI